MSGLGTRLRLQREQQQVALHTIADRTKIKLSLLEGLENDDLSQWPSGIFRRAYVRDYARAIGLDPGEVIREFLARYPESSDDVSAVLAEVRAGDDASQGPRRPPTRLRFLFNSAVSALKPVRQPVVHTNGNGHASNGHAVIDQAPVTFADAENGLALTMEQHEELAVLEEPAIEGAFDPALSEFAAPPPAESPVVVQEPTLSAPAASIGGEGHDVDAERMFAELAGLCSRLGWAASATEVEGVLVDTVDLLQASGAVVWVCDRTRTTLAPALAHGYPDAVKASMDRVRVDQGTAVGAVFRDPMLRVLPSDGDTAGAVVVPLIGPAGCVGVLSVEFHRGLEARSGVSAILSILAAQLATIVAPMKGSDRR